MNTDEETRMNEESDPKQGKRPKEKRPVPDEEAVKEFQEYLLDIGVRI